MGKNCNYNLGEPRRATGEIILTFNATRFNEAKVREAIQKQTDKYSDLALFIGKPKMSTLTRRAVAITCSWQAHGSPLSYRKWSSSLSALASATQKSVKALNDVELIECKIVVVDRDDGTKTYYTVR